MNFSLRAMTKTTMHRLIPSLLFVLPLLALPGLAPAVSFSGVAAVAQPDTSRRATKATKTSRPVAAKPIRAPAVVTSTGPGQAGYVHYWLITAPDGSQEMQIGIELPDQRIAWSFPGAGVRVAPFIADGVYEVHDQRYTVQHRYGLRPYRNEPAVARLQTNLQQRMKYWLDNATPYCELNGVSREVCVSCFGFAAQILYPGKSRMYADFPRDFPRTGGADYHTTEDLLLYLAGLHALPNAEARQRRMEQLGGPPALREELTRLSAEIIDNRPTAVAVSTPAKRRLRAPAKSALHPG